MGGGGGGGGVEGDVDLGAFEEGEVREGVGEGEEVPLALREVEDFSYCVFLAGGGITWRGGGGGGG